jgi:4-amino-4-deoxy-L-arabinose transferase-like glycosyltransferase
MNAAMPYANNWLLLTGIAIVFFSILLQCFNKYNYSAFSLFIAAFLIRLFSAHLDPFLHDWDERFHALVARNMMDHPFVPVLRADTLLDYSRNSWCCNSLWLHKQPLFLWQMALSMKIFGISEYAIRYPSAMMGVIMVLFVYRIALLLSKNRDLAFVSALFFCCSHYQLELISGVVGMDHNDMAFCFYVLASIWAYAEYINNRKLSWVLLIGLFSGCAILNKWLTGLLVFSGWGVNLILSARDKEVKKEAGHMLIALLVCAVVFVPWQLYIWHYFPVQARIEYDLVNKHINEVVEGTQTYQMFYWDKLPYYFGEYSWYAVLPGIILLFTNRYRNKISISLLAMFFIAFIFFSFVVLTKVDSFFFIVAPVGFICMAVTFITALSVVKIPRAVYLVLAGVAALIIFDFKHTTLSHDPADPARQAKILNTQLYKNAKNLVPPGTQYVMNLSAFAETEFMFFQKDLPAYAYCVSEADTRTFKQKKIRIAVFDNHGDCIIPPYIWDYPYLFIIHQQLR